MKWFKRTLEKSLQPEEQSARGGFFTTDISLSSRAGMGQRIRSALAKTFQANMESLTAVNEKNELVTGASHAMDEAYPDLQQSKLRTSTGGHLPIAQLEWYANQGFIGWQTCAMLAQNWLIDKACSMPARDAARHGWELSINDGTHIDAKIFDTIRRIDKRFKMKKQCIDFIKNGRIFGIRHALFLVEGIDYTLPFNIDGVKPESYRGITQIDPYWVSPILDSAAAADPASQQFYSPTWWLIQGKRVHHSHMVIMRNGDEVPDILKPSYIYGGIPTPQKIYERVYAAERTANEAPMLAMTKRLTTLKIDINQAMMNQEKLTEKMEFWSSLMNNFGIKVIGNEEEIQQFDTALTALDETIMTQYQLVAAASDVPATKLLGTTPKGFNATGEYDAKSYHEYLESIQENELSPLIERHTQLLIKSFIAPKYGIKPFHFDVKWNPVDSPTANERADINLKKSQTDKNWVDAGAVDSFDIRERLIADPDSGYSGIAPIVEGGPGDREAEQEAAALMIETANAPPEKPKQQEVLA
jgi:phage-related protein (TIGR01555 family)